jgi:hypothetical protein
MNSASRGLRPTVGLRRPKNPLCVGEGRRPARSARRGRFQSARKPSAHGRPAPTGKTLPFASAKADARRAALGEADFNRRESLRPTVGLRRPKRHPSRRRRPTPSAQRPERPISIGVKAFGQRSAYADRKGILRVGEGRRPARSARRGRFQSARKPSANGRPAPTEKAVFASTKADAQRASARRGRFQSA